jgi:spermidine synthase
MSTDVSVSTQKAKFGADGWFHEESVCWPGQAMSLKVKSVLLDKQTQFQHLTVFENDGPWGRVMTLDGAIQLTDKDEFVYHECMAHVPLCAHPKPRHVLIIGGGDGGVLREVLRHECVERCDLVDIDGDVIEASKAFFPAIAAGFASPRAKATVGDGAAFVASAPAESYDVVIVDSSDPEGPASALFGSAFYRDVFRILRPGGVVCSQGESMWLHADLIQRMLAMLVSADVGFADARYGLVYIPTYPCGSIGSLLGAKAFAEGGGAALDVRRPVRCFEPRVQSELKYYTPELHAASFALPQFAAAKFAVSRRL